MSSPGRKSWRTWRRPAGLLGGAGSAEQSGAGGQHHPYNGDAISVSPLTWSHETYVIVVMEYVRKVEK